MAVIAHVTTRFLGGGSERSLGDVVHALPTHQHVLLVGRDHDASRIRALIGDVRTIVVPTLVRQPNPILDAQAAMALRRTIGDLRPDLVHTIQSKAGILGRAAARWARVPIVVHSVVMANFGRGFSPLGSQVYRAAERLAASWTTEYIVCGIDLRDRFLRAGIASPGQYTVIRSSVDAEAYRSRSAAGRSANRAALGLPVEGRAVLFAGALESRKGGGDLPAFLAELRRTNPDVTLLIAGVGPLKHRMEARFQALGVGSSVRFLGYTERMPEVFAASDCLVMLSRAEGLATVLVQAIGSGVPFVSYQVDGPRELIARGAVGSVVRSGDLAAAAREVSRMLAGRPRDAGVDLSEWDPAEVARRYRAFFDRLLQVR
jgi:glycosyltransferase involved in cell wall biosynthesis